MFSKTPLATMALLFPLLALSADMSGCGKPHSSGFNDGQSNHNIQIGDQTRYYAVYVPPGYNDSPNTPRKVIFDYHGNGGTPSNQYQNSKYDKYDSSYLVVYPAGLDGSWQSAPYAPNPPHDDLSFTTQLLAKIRTQYCVDSNHVYASGKSNGGGFVDFLACSNNGDEFAAFGMAAAALYSDNSLGACSKKRAIIEAHGQKDCTICYQGGSVCCGNQKQGPTPNVATWASWWGQRDGCAANAGQTVAQSGYNVINYSCSGKTDVVKHYQIPGLEHCWPSSSGDNYDYTRGGCSDKSLDFTPKVLDFFGKWSLSNAPKN